MTTQSLKMMNPYSLFFKALANAARMRIIDMLRDGPKSVTDICREL
ncbi:winged helix-turn-helix transcriptional regulator [Candidatus Bathyarchaeota archaeon]|nr:winged helix-turn-helix transcriptional regulator [Candidatus Bathyarchaeota archaeon]